MANVYYNKKAEYSYKLYKDNKYFRKARAIVVDKSGMLCLIQVTFKDDRKTHYLLPGGGVDDGESSKQAAVREAFEEFGVKTKIKKYIDKNYYKVPMKFEDNDFISRRVEYYYLCEIIEEDENAEFGVDGEFSKEDREYKKVKLSLEDIEKINHEDLNSMQKRTYDKLIEILKQNKK